MNNIPDRSEEAEQRAVARYLDIRGFCWFHTPNGGNRNAITGGKLKAQGVKRGVPDIMIFDSPHEGCPGIAIELKRRTKGATTPEQIEWLDRLRVRKWKTFVCRGSDEAIGVIESEYGRP